MTNKFIICVILCVIIIFIGILEKRQRYLLQEENAYIMGYERCEKDYSLIIMDQEEVDMGKTISEWTPEDNY